MFLELVSQPSVKLFSHSGGIFLFAFLYFLFLLFVTPGIIAVYLEDRMLHHSASSLVRPAIFSGRSCDWRCGR